MALFGNMAVLSTIREAGMLRKVRLYYPTAPLRCSPES